MDHKYKVGDLVHPKAVPSAKLTVRKYMKRIYYCRSASDPAGKDLVFFENELEGSNFDSESKA